MSVSDPWEKIEWGADSEPRKNERVPSSDHSSPQKIWAAMNKENNYHLPLRMQKKNILIFIFYLITYPQAHYLSLKTLIFCKNFVSKFYFTSVISARSTPL
jgi:hypothetical protein